MKVLFEGIMKIQVPVSHSPGMQPLALAYAERHRHEMQFPVEELGDKMGTEIKKFFYCKVIVDKGTRIEIGDEAPWQDW
jgi:hypothetical protein